MKNLKKALVLVLAFAMIFSMFTMNASAASFSDDDAIVNDEAVGAMTQLGIINGYEDGTFLPTQVVTRAEMCKMICVALNGGTAPILDSSSVVFSDTKGHWANAYISYCFTKGIVSGDAGKGGAFRPDATVTGIEAAKMMLVALGYNAAVAGFTGADWSNNVAMAANDKSLFTNLGALNVVAGLSRDNAAQLIYNGLNVEMVTYTNILGTDANGQLTSTPTISNLTGKTVMTEKYNAIKVEGVVTDNEFLTGDASKGKTSLTITNAPAITAFGATDTFKVATGANEVGKNVTLYVRQSITSPADGTQATVIGTPVVNSTNKIYTTNKALVNDPTKSNDVTKTLLAAGLKFQNANTVSNYANFAAPSPDATAVTNIANYINALGVEAQYIDNNGDGIIDVVTKLTYAFGKVTTATTAGDGTLNVSVLGSAGSSIATTKANTEVVGFADLGLAVNNYVKYYLVAATTKYYVEKMTGVTVDVASTTGSKVNASGTTYSASSLANTTDMSAAAGNQATLDTSVTIGKTAVFYLDNAGAVIYVDSVTSTAKYLMLIDSSTSYGAFNDTLTAKVIHDDGTTATVVISKVGGTTVTSANISGGGGIGTALDAAEIVDGAGAIIYSYTVDSNGKYQLTAQTTVRKAAGGAGAAAITNNVPTVDGTTGNVIIANTTAPIVVGNAALTSFTKYDGIAAVPSSTNADVFAVVGTGSIAKVIFTYGGAGATSSNNFMYVLSKTPTITKDSNDADVYTYNVVRGGEITTVVGTTATMFPGAGLYKVDLTGTKVSAAVAVDSRIVDRSAVTVAANGVVGNATGSYLYDANTRFFIVKGGVATAATVDSIVTSGATQDKVSFILGTGAANNTAQYVFIERDAYVTVTAPTVTNANGLTLVATLNRATASVGDTIVVSVVVTGTAGAAGTITIAGVTPLAGTALTGTIANMTKTSDTVIAVTGAAVTTGTIVFAYTLTAGNPAATVTAA